MSDYIKKNDAMKIICSNCTDPCALVEKANNPCAAIKELVYLPSADVAPVRHAHWIKHEGSKKDVKDSIECSACGVWIDDMPRKTFCPNCGSIMYRYGDEDE